jgi:hypothetical protein
VPTNKHRALNAFRFHATDIWRQTLRRRSQKGDITWERITRLANDWLPHAKILHPWPQQRFAVGHPMWEPDAGNRPYGCVSSEGWRVQQEKGLPGQESGAPVVWIAGWRETKTLKPIDNVSLGKTTSHRAVTTVNAKVASKVRSPEGRVLNHRAKATWGAEI